jgi:hypothetical protein
MAVGMNLRILYLPSFEDFFVFSLRQWQLESVINGDSRSYCFPLSSQEDSLLSENKGDLAKDPKVNPIPKRRPRRESRDEIMYCEPVL